LETLSSRIKSNAREISGCVPVKKKLYPPVIGVPLASLEIHAPRKSDAIEPKIAARKYQILQ
jgi:hypothetical protein